MNTKSNLSENNLQEQISAPTLFSRLVSMLQHGTSTLSNAGENMGIVHDMIHGDWKPRYLLDFTARCAYEFIGADNCFVHITEDDIAWDTLTEVPEKALDRAHGLFARFPTSISKFKNGVAQVNWMINPDGMYYADSDGYGMTDDDEIELYGFIDRQGHVVVKFRLINDDWKLLKQMRAEAEKIINQQNTEQMENQNTPSQNISNAENTKTQVFNVIILDKSGSMETIRQAAIDGLNETIHGIKRAQETYAETQDHYVSLVAFCACEMKQIYDKTPIAQAHPLTHRDYQPCCCTPLYDAMGFTLNGMRKHVQSIKDAVVVVTIITDGYENASREYNARSIKRLVEELKTEGWSFTYMGANQNALEVAERMSIRNSRNFEANDQCTRHVMAKDMHTKMNFFARLHGIVRSQETLNLPEAERKQCYTAAADDAFDEEERI